jgi:hypothetical protein
MKETDVTVFITPQGVYLIFSTGEIERLSPKAIIVETPTGSIVDIDALLK